jgi:hypothetical protein
MDWEAKRRRKQDVAARAANAETMWSRCRIIGCGNRTTAGERKGLNRMYCRKHEDHFERHGSYVKPSYTASELEPYRKAAKSWLQAHGDDKRVQLAIRGIEGLYRRAGQHVEAFRLRGLSPKDRARAAWARLREGGVDPKHPLAAWLAIELILMDDPQAERKVEFKRVQSAKLVHRMASGSHKRWERKRPDNRIVVQELHKYPHSRGNILRHIGEQLERAAHLLTPAVGKVGLLQN